MSSISIILCTRNNAPELARTLASIALALAAMPGEVLLIDNGSTDDTAQVARASPIPNLRYFFEPRVGKGFAYNTGLANASGDILFFTDDDIRVPENWLARLSSPIAQGRADAVAGGVNIAPHLLRKWMRPEHLLAQADTTHLDSAHPAYMVGANMAIGRHVFHTISGFDTALGPGALGYGDDLLLTLQIRQAGFRIATCFDTAVEHHFNPARLARDNWLSSAERNGRSNAYIAYHWNHQQVPKLRLGIAARRAYLLLWALGSPGPCERSRRVRRARVSTHLWHRVPQTITR